MDRRKAAGVLILAALLLVGCGGDDSEVTCRRVRYIHQDGSYEHITVCDERPIQQCRGIGVTDDQGHTEYRMECTDGGVRDWWRPVR